MYLFYAPGREWLPLDAFADVGGQVGHGDADLLHGIAVPDGDGLILQRLEIDRDAKRRADLILPAIEFADAGGVVVDGAHLAGRLKRVLDALGEGDDLRFVLFERQDGDFVGR